MDAVEFIRQRERLCNTVGHCGECPLTGFCEGNGVDIDSEDAEPAVKALEQWVRQNPENTRQNQFLKDYPHARLDAWGIIDIEPCQLDAEYCGRKENKLNTCHECKKAYWQEALRNG